MCVDGETLWDVDAQYKEDAEESIAEALLDYSEDQIKVYRTIEVGWETEQKQVEVTILD